ncbi:hypothetical protein HNY73_023075 [Argiope bruennichi]|uniref:Uncharacterized protein n=1 Tax=Argiope bruennichi TaxID=94029 RepID=A0A8T0E4J5_ARGBR|nr:hypothetical protein HNY73_023075 [Argiope bruennichi]
MLRNNNRKLKDIPPDVRLSLEFLDDVLEEYAAEAEEAARRTEKHLGDMPVDVRHSLEVLDDILTIYEDEEMEDPNAETAVEDLRTLDAAPPEVSKSLEMLDSIIDEVEQEANAPRRRRNGTQGRRNRHEDIRHSLEVLDSVLAEFDDCLESWDTSPRIDIKKSLDSSADKKFPSDNNRVKESRCFDSVPVDDNKFSSNNARGGSTSHNSSSCVQEQPKVGSPPPIPKRSPTTRLSEQILNPFPFPSDDTSLDSYDSNRSDSGVHGDCLSDHAPISGLSSLKKNGDTAPRRSAAKNTYDADNCANCGCDLKRSSLAMESAEGADIPSPFQLRKQVFENKIADGLSNTPLPTGINRSYGSSFRIMKIQTPEQLDTSSGPVSLPANLTGSSIDSTSQQLNGLSSFKHDDENEISLPSTHHAVNCTCREKIQKLNTKFSETRRLLKQNSINGLDSKPPSFVPPPPPMTTGNSTQLDSVPYSDSSVETSRNPPLRANGNSSGLLKVKDSLQDSEVDSCHSVDSSNESLQSGNLRMEDSLHSSKLVDSSRLCNRCSSSLSVHLSTTIEDLPNLLPTDALNRPHLGLSYSLEDDLSPGVKEIQQSSTPRSDASSLSLFKTKDSSLSTFSHSASSLGYVSSQSDLELNNIPTIPNKVPVSTFKSRTLPNGLDRSPFYSPMDEVFDRSHSPGESKDHNGNRYPKPGHVSHENLLQLRSSSAPPLPEEEKPKKKLFRFSRKDKSKKKNDDSSSLKSDLSFDEGIILKKVGALDGSTVLHDYAWKTTVGNTLAVK